MQKQLFLPSTPLNIILSCVIAGQQKNDISKKLWIIDQKNCDKNIYLKALSKWDSSPFVEIECFSAGIKGTGKRAYRLKLFDTFRKKIDDWIPNTVFVGSDRRVEFQFIMQQLCQINKPATGVYMDDGLYTYSGPPKVWWKDGINALLKKFAYGSWWQEPETVGASNWIKKAYVFKPNNVIEPLKIKQLQEVKSEWLSSRAIKDLSEILFQYFMLDGSTVESLDVIIILPHPNDILKMPGYEKQLSTRLKELCIQGKNVAVKYHPRVKSEDPLDLLNQGASLILPKDLAFEFILPIISSGVLIEGGIGTSILTTKWLRPEIGVKVHANFNCKIQMKYIKVFEKFDIEIENYENK